MVIAHTVINNINDSFSITDYYNITVDLIQLSELYFSYFVIGNGNGTVANHCLRSESLFLYLNKRYS